MNIHTLELSDGRSLEIASVGTPSPHAIIFHHGTPGSYKTWESSLALLEKLGVFAVAFSRAGYGMSSRRVGRSVISNTSDTQAIVDHFQIEKFASIGWSGGGPHCLADTTLDKCLAAISLAGVAPFNAEGLNFLEGMGEENHIEFGAAVKGAESIENWMKEFSPPMKSVTGADLIEAFGGLIGDADKNVLTAEVAEAEAEAFRHALVETYYGWMDDDLAFVEDWGFDITSISKPVELWQGDEDFMVPHAHGKWLATKIPTATLKFREGEGHISLVENQIAEIVESAKKYF